MRSRARTVRMPAEDRTRRCTSRAPVRLVAALPDNRIADPIIQPASGAVYVHVGRAKLVTAGVRQVFLNSLYSRQSYSHCNGRRESLKWVQANA